MLLALFLLTVVPAAVALVARGPSAAVWRRLARCWACLPLVWLGTWALQQASLAPELLDTIVKACWLVWLLTLSAYAAAAPRVVWKWIIRYLAFVWIGVLGHEVQGLLRLVSNDAWRDALQVAWTCGLLTLVVGYAGYVLLTDFHAPAKWVAAQWPGQPPSFSRWIWPAVAGAVGFVLMVLREPLLTPWSLSDSMHTAAALGLGSLFVLVVAAALVIAIEELRQSRLPWSFRLASLIGAVAIYGLLAVSPDARCLPFLLVLAALPAWRRWELSALYGALLGLLLVSCVHAGLNDVTSFGPRMFLYLSIICFCYGYFFVPRAGRLKHSI